MLTTASKAYATLAALAFVVFFVYMAGIGGDRQGDIVLISFALGFGLLSWVAASRRVDDVAPDFDPSTSPDRTPVLKPGPAASPSTYPLVAALGAGVMATSAAFGPYFLLLGVVVLVFGLLGWLGQVWREHPSWTPAVGDTFSTRVLSPFALPLTAVLIGIVVVISVSRILLNVTPHAAVAVSLVIASVVFIGCTAAALGTQLSPKLLGIMAAIAMVAVVAAGITTGVRGNRQEEKITLPVTPVRIVAQGTAYVQKEITAPIDRRFQLTFVNNDVNTYHDVGIYSAQSGGQPFIAFTPFAGPGHEKYAPVDLQAIGLKQGTTYYFRCDFHPAMVGTFVVTAGGGSGTG